MKARRVTMAVVSLALIGVMCGCTLMQCASNFGIANGGDQTINQTTSESGGEDFIVVCLLIILILVLAGMVGGALAR